MIIRTPLTPSAVEEHLRLWIEREDREGACGDAWLAQMEGQPQAFAGHVSAGMFTMWQGRGGRYVWCPVASGQILPASSGSELRIGIRPAVPDLADPALLLVFSGIGAARYGEPWLLVLFGAVALGQSALSWAFGVRRIRRALLAWVDGAEVKGPSTPE